MFVILLVALLQNPNYVGMTFWFPMKWSCFIHNNIFNTLLLYLYFDGFWNSIHWVCNTVKDHICEGYHQKHQYIISECFQNWAERVLLPLQDFYLKLYLCYIYIKKNLMLTSVKTLNLEPKG